LDTFLFLNDGTLHVFAGLGAEGDGIDSNGYIVVNGATIAGGTPSGSDELLDSDCGNTVNGGNVITIGSSKEFGMRDKAFDQEPPREWDKGRRPMDDGNFKPEDMPEEFKKEK